MRNSCLFFLLFSFAFLPQIFSQGGLLDSTFSTDGKVVTIFTPSGNDKVSGLAIQPDQKIVAAGTVGTTGHADFGLARYLPDGSLDDDFGANGKGVLDFGFGDDFGKAVVLQPDGKIIVAGYAATNSSGDRGFALARFLENGDPDVTFSGNGRLSTTIGPGNSEGSSVALQADGKIVVAGTAYLSPTQGVFALIRYTSLGLPDASFGQGGIVITALGSPDAHAQAMVIRPDGKIIVAGFAMLGAHADFALAQFHPDGTIDSLFGTDGRQLTDFTGFDDFGQALVLQPDGKIVVGGITAAGTTQKVFALARYQPDGTPDNSFSQDGKTQTSLGSVSDGIQAILLQPDGKIVAAGHSYNAPYNAYTFGLARYQTDGSLDPGFGGSGKVTTFMPGAVGNDQAYAVALQADGKIVAGGGSTSLDFAVARYLSGLPISGTNAPLFKPALRLYPNPVATMSTVEYVLFRTEMVSITMYDPLGKMIARPVNRIEQAAGPHFQSLELPENLPPGVYTLVLSTSAGQTSLKMVK